MTQANDRAQSPPDLSTRRLSFFGQRLTVLPPDIEQYSQVETLDLNGNLLESIPASIGAMKSLKVLYAGGNRLRSLPDELFSLPHLRVLDIDNNQLVDLPDLFKTLTQLEVLRVEKNNITSIPVSLAPLLKTGLKLTAYDNPLMDPLPTIMERGADALASYLTSLAGSESVAIYEARALLVGEGNVGKSSLVASLRNRPFVEGRNTTHGIEISSLSLAHPQIDTEMRISLWDFGGQEVYRVTHQFFFSARSLYLVVWKAREGVEANDVEGWIRRIRIRTGHDVRIILVATHGDERRPEIDYARLKASFGDSLVGSCTVDNSSGAGISDLREVINSEAAELPQMGQVLSTSWLATRTSIREEANSNPQISFDRFAEIAISNGVEDTSEIDTLAQLLHDLGEVVYFGEDDGLRDIVVLNPEWLTKAIGYVLEDIQTRDSGGVLEHDRLQAIWAESTIGPSYPRQYHPYFLRLMEKFDVSYRLENINSSLVAQLTPWERPVLPWSQELPVPKSIRSVRIICVLGEPAPGLIAWLTVRNHQNSTGRHWRHGVFLRHPVDIYDSEALIELRDSTHLSLEVRAPSPDYFFSVIRASIEHLICWRWPGLSYRFYVPCSTVDAKGHRCSGLFPLEGLARRREQGGSLHWCLECDTEHDVGRLLTGFSAKSVSYGREFDRIERQLAGVQGGLKRIETLAAEGAVQLRRVIFALSAEVVDCPRLFTLEDDDRRRGLGRLKSEKYSITLWCEHPGKWHPCPKALYVLTPPRDWLVRFAPYAKMIVKTLQLVLPIGGAAIGLIVPDEVYNDASKRLELAKSVVDALPEELSVPPVNAKVKDDSMIGHVSPAQGEGLRMFRALLFDLDKNRGFGGLRRALTESGDYVWVCPEHYSRYDPGLPRDLV